MKRTILLPLMCVLFLIPFKAQGQYWKIRRYEASIGIGSANCYGDIGGSLTSDNLYGLKDIRPDFTRPVIHFSAGYKLDHKMTLQANLFSGLFYGNDTHSKNESTRDYSYTSTIIEPSFQFMYYILPEFRGMESNAIYNGKGLVTHLTQIYLYVFGGGGAVVNFPVVKDINGNKVTTDRYADPKAKFKRVGIVFPVGIGLRYNITPLLLVNLEFGRRYTLTDSVDGYSSRYSTSNDVYDFTTLSLVYRIKTGRSGGPQLKRK